ncbi:hypothetical protein LEMLEM_LOCUS1710, partial [Lemmus lemmus]
EPGAPVCCSWRRRWVSQLAHCRNSGRILTAPHPQMGLEGRMAGQGSVKSNKKLSPRPLEACSKREKRWREDHQVFLLLPTSASHPRSPQARNQDHSQVLYYSAFSPGQQRPEEPIGGFQIMHHHTPIRMAKIRLTVPCVGKNMEKQILIHL